jgi:hypothetical protein
VIAAHRPISPLRASRKEPLPRILRRTRRLRSTPNSRPGSRFPPPLGHTIQIGPSWLTSLRGRGCISWWKRRAACSPTTYAIRRAPKSPVERLTSKP